MTQSKRSSSHRQTSGNAHSINFLPLLIDRTMNTFPAIKNALTEAR